MDTFRFFHDGKSHTTVVNIRLNIFNLTFGKDAFQRVDKEKAKRPTFGDITVNIKLQSTLKFDNKALADESTKEGDFWLDGTGI